MAVATGTALLGSALIGGAATAAVGAKQAKTQKKIAGSQLEFQQQMAERTRPLPFRPMTQEELRTATFTGGDLEGLTLATPTAVQRPELVSPGEFALDPEITQDYRNVLASTRQRATEGLPDTLVSDIRRSQQEAAATALQTGTQDVDAYLKSLGYEEGLGAGGVATRAVAERVLAPFAEQQAQTELDLALRDYAEKIQAESDLLNVGNTFEARQLKAERENIARQSIQNSINQTLANWDLNMIDRFNQLVLNQQSMFAQQGQQLAAAQTGYSRDMANIANNYYGGIADSIGNITSGVFKMGVMEQMHKNNLELIQERTGQIGAKTAALTGGGGGDGYVGFSGEGAIDEFIGMGNY